MINDVVALLTVLLLPLYLVACFVIVCGQRDRYQRQRDEAMRHLVRLGGRDGIEAVDRVLEVR